MGWAVTDPLYECFRMSVNPGNYQARRVTESLHLAKGASYVFVLQLADPTTATTVPSRSYRITYGDRTVVARNTLQHNQVTRFAIPK
eukprot:11213372-Ditylum_brightwellii.AAC.1